MKEQLHNGVVPRKVTDLSPESASLAHGREERARILLTGMDSSRPNTFWEDGAFRLGEAAAGTGGRGVTLLQCRISSEEICWQRQRQLPPGAMAWCDSGQPRASLQHKRHNIVAAGEQLHGLAQTVFILASGPVC